MPYILAADIGGTKTLLQINSVAGDGVPLLKKSYPSAAYASLEDMLDVFFAEAGVRDVSSACFALAGPVSGRVVQLTNLPWVVDGDKLAAHFSIQHVALINDFEAVGYGIPLLQPADLLTLQQGKEVAEAVQLVVGAGTGLGVAWLTKSGDTCEVHPSEGGHMDFAPADEMQSLLLRYLRHQHNHVSYERILSGPGLIAIFNFMRDSGFETASPELIAAMSKEDPAAVITRFSATADEVITSMTMEMFLSIYGAFVGNLALAMLPRGGVYVAGGIAAKIAPLMQQGGFIKALQAKGRFKELLSTFPLNIVLNENVGLLGAYSRAKHHAG